MMTAKESIALPSEPDGLLAARLIEEIARSAASDVIMVARSETRAARLQQAVAALAPEIGSLLLPAWDCLPYDRASPSRTVMGARMEVLHRLSTQRGGPVLLIASVDAASQRLPPFSSWAALTLRDGEDIDPEEVRLRLERLGYDLGDQVEEAGDAAIRASVIDVFPAAARLPCRIEHTEGRITEIRQFDPATQRSRDSIPEVTLPPASELVLPSGSDTNHLPGIEHLLPEFHPDLVTIFELMPKAVIVLDAEVDDLRAQYRADVKEAFAAVRALPGNSRANPSAPDRLYLDAAAWDAGCRDRPLWRVASGGDESPGALPRFRRLSDFVEFARGQSAAGLRIGLSGPARARRVLVRALRQEPEPVSGWLGLTSLPPGTLATLEGSLESGFLDPDAAVITPADVLGNRIGQRSDNDVPAAFEMALAPGDAVIHLDHGMGALRGIETIATDETATDCLRLEYAGDAKLLVPAEEIDRLWRYGAEADGVTLDRLKGESWPKRRAEVEADVIETAQRLVALARKREMTEAPVLTARGPAYARVVARFPHTPTSDQAEAITAVEADLAAGRPMDRLVCGDVGYGKTEVALRAAAIAALSGWQVVLVAPTTVLVRQHVQTFRRRFAGLGVRVASLSRLTPAAEARAVRAGLADGSVNIVIGTQALAGKNVRFAKPGLLIIDEEQRFGVRQKQALRRLRDGMHVLTLTATPIPRTLQAALAGLQELSVIATPPARRQPVRSFRIPFDAAVVGQALQRERRRGGQSFVVCPRVEDIAPMRARLEQAAPGLDLIEAHGGMKPEQLDDAMLRFANGESDVLLATNIVESGLDVPRANTMLIWRPDRFGLSQLHQLRGRVGRGRARGIVYLLTDPETRLGSAAAKRLDALESRDRLGAGFSISARDLDLRGAGDLLGEDQAGHVKLIGLELYQHLLRGAVCVARGERPPEAWTPELTLNLPAYLPSEYVADEASRLTLHARLGRAVGDGDAEAITLLEEEVEDRFGPHPEPVRHLFALAELRVTCRRLGVARLEVGPSGAAADLRTPPRAELPELERRGNRLVLRRESRDPGARLDAARSLLGALQIPRNTRVRELA